MQAIGDYVQQQAVQSALTETLNQLQEVTQPGQQVNVAPVGHLEQDSQQISQQFLDALTGYVEQEVVALEILPALESLVTERHTLQRSEPLVTTSPEPEIFEQLLNSITNYVEQAAVESEIIEAVEDLTDQLTQIQPEILAQAKQLDTTISNLLQQFLAVGAALEQQEISRQAVIALSNYIEHSAVESALNSQALQTLSNQDYIHNHGADRFKRGILGKVVDIAAWEKQFQAPELLKTGKVPPADVVAHEIAEQYQDQLAFNNEIGRWMRYSADSPGMWSQETEEYIEAIVGTVLDGKNITGYGSYSYLTNVIKTLRRLLIVRRWEERSPKELLPFINGVLEVSTGKLLDHSPGYRLTWQLPRNHDSNATDWSTINAYLNHLSNGKAAIKEILLCFCNAVLKGRSDLQKFLHLIGLAGSGKGTFARLLTDLIGSDNIYSGTLDDWCSNRFESANAYKKRLVVFWDEDKQTGKLGKFLSLTGGDWIRAEEKGKKAFQYRYDGMVAVLSNIPIFTGDAASRIARRVVTIPCNSTVPLGQRRDLNAEFTPELDAFTNHVLSIPDSQVTKVLMGLADIPECTLEFWESRIRTDSIAAWVNDWVIYDVLAETPIGSNKEEGLEGSLPQTLYGSYCLHCKQSGTQPKANKNFSPDLLELCRSVLGWEIERKVTKTGKFINALLSL